MTSQFELGFQCGRGGVFYSLLCYFPTEFSLSMHVMYTSYCLLHVDLLLPLKTGKYSCSRSARVCVYWTSLGFLNTANN